MSELRILAAGLDLMAEALRQQQADVLALDWRPPAGGDLDDVAMLTAAYGDDRIEEANRRALARLQEARPMIVGAGAAGDLIPGLEGRTVLHAGPPVEWELMCAPSATRCAARWCWRDGRPRRRTPPRWSRAATCASRPLTP